MSRCYVTHKSFMDNKTVAMSSGSVHKIICFITVLYKVWNWYTSVVINIVTDLIIMLIFILVVILKNAKESLTKSCVTNLTKLRQRVSLQVAGIAQMMLLSTR